MMRYLIMGILDEKVTGRIHKFREKLCGLTGNDLALRFPVHITLRGPFWAESKIDVLIEPLYAIVESCSRFQIVLDPPCFVNPDLLWLPVNPESCGASKLMDMHLLLEHELKENIVKDDTSPGHFGMDYRPHVTIGWGVTSSICREGSLFSACEGVSGTLEKVALGRYPAEWPKKGMVEIVASVALNSNILP